jgi:hypothetical protein
MVAQSLGVRQVLLGFAGFFAQSVKSLRRGSHAAGFALAQF